MCGSGKFLDRARLCLRMLRPENTEFIGQTRTVNQAEPPDLSMQPDEVGTVQARLKSVVGFPTRA